LNSTKRMLVDLRQVSDPEYRAELERAGVKVSPVNPVLQGSPGVGHELLKPDIKPSRKPMTPKILHASALAASVKLVDGGRRIPSRRAALVGEEAPQGRAVVGEEAPQSRPGVALGIAAAGAAVTSAAILGLHSVTKERDQ